MKIQSPFRDYYDHQAYVYGGGDPKITYNRNRIGEAHRTNTNLIVKGHDVTLEGLPSHSSDFAYIKLRHDTKWLAICGKLYLIVSHVGELDDLHTPGEGTWSVISRQRHPLVWEHFHTSRQQFWRARRPVKLDGNDEYLEKVVQLSRIVNAPVFTFTVSRADVVHVDGNIPILGNMGVPALLSAEQLYQDISYFIGNTMKDNPDGMPVSPMSNTEKISAAGFDLIKSFRHRK